MAASTKSSAAASVSGAWPIIRRYSAGPTTRSIADIRIDVAAQFAPCDTARPYRREQLAARVDEVRAELLLDRAGRPAPRRRVARTRGHSDRCRSAEARAPRRSDRHGPTRCPGRATPPSSPTGTRRTPPRTCWATTCRWSPCSHRCGWRSPRWSSPEGRPRAAARRWRAARRCATPRFAAGRALSEASRRQCG